MEWEEWDGESGMYIAEGSLGGFNGGHRVTRRVGSVAMSSDTTRPGRIKRHQNEGPHPTRERSGRGAIPSSKGSENFGFRRTARSASACLP